MFKDVLIAILFLVCFVLLVWNFGLSSINSDLVLRWNVSRDSLISFCGCDFSERVARDNNLFLACRDENFFVSSLDCLVVK
jgi:hypothetical protein